VLPISERVELLGEEVTTARERHDAERQRRAEFSGEAVSSLTREARPLVLPVDHVFGGSSEAGAKHQATEQLKASKEAVGNRTGLSPVWNTIGFLRSIPSFLILLAVILGVVFVVSRVLWSIVRGTVGFAFGPGLIPLIVIVVGGVAWGVWRSKRVAAPTTAHELGESPASGNEAPDAQPALSQPDADDEEEDSTALEPYRRSGSTGWRHVPLALVASVAAAMLVGAIHGGIQAAYIDTFSSSRPFVLPWEFLVAPAIFGALLVGFLIPVFLAVNLAKIRSGVLGALAGCLMVVPTVGATLFMMIRLETVQGAASIPLFWLGMEGPAVLLITWGTTTVVLLGVGAKFGWGFALEPFCERCGAWAAPVYTDLKVGEPEDVPLLSKRVREGRIEQLADLPVTHPERTLSVSLLACPHCNRTGFLSVTCAQPSSSLRSETGDPNTLAKNLVLGARATSMAARLSDPSWRPD
jgi:hypothetical protein